MPYVFVEELEEGVEGADVVERSEYEQLRASVDELASQRDTLIERAETAEKDAREARDKYAHAFITSPQRIKEENSRDVRRESRPSTYSELFAGRSGN